MSTHHFVIAVALTMLAPPGCKSKERQSCEHGRDWLRANSIELQGDGDAREFTLRALEHHFVDMCVDDEALRRCAAEIESSDGVLDSPCAVAFDEAMTRAMAREIERLNADVPAPS